MIMSKDQLRAVFDRISTWPEERQQELAELALQIEAEMSDRAYQASGEELEAIDEALAGEVASEEEIEAAFAAARRS